MVVMVVFTTMAIGLNMVVGYAGLLDLGYVAFYAVGAYTAGWFASQQFDQVSINVGAVGDSRTGCRASTSRCGSILPIAGLLTMLSGIAIGLPTLRLRGDYLAIVTLGFGEIVPQFVRNADNVVRLRPHARHVRDHPDRLARVRRHRGQRSACPRASVSRSERSQWYFWTAVVILLITVFCSVRLRDSRLGRAWVAIREDETAAAAMGIPLMRTKTWAYALGAFFGGVAGAFYASFKVGRLPGGLLLQHLGLPALHGHPRRHGQRLGRAPRRHDPRLPQRRGARHDRLEDPAVGDPEARRTSTRRSTSSGSTGSSSC